MWLGAAQPLGVVAQAVIGGIVVLTKLNPAAVSVHFLVSAAVVAAAVALHMRCSLQIAPGTGGPRGSGGNGSPRTGGRGSVPPGATVRRDLRPLRRWSRSPA